MAQWHVAHQLCSSACDWILVRIQSRALEHSWCGVLIAIVLSMLIKTGISSVFYVFASADLDVKLWNELFRFVMQPDLEREIIQGYKFHSHHASTYIVKFK